MSRKHSRAQQIGKRAHCNFGQTKIAAKTLPATLVITQDSTNRPPFYKYTWTYGSLSGVVYADNRSTVRALIKRDLGIRKKHRLPVAVEIVREPNIEDNDNEDDPAGSTATDSNGNN